MLTAVQNKLNIQHQQAAGYRDRVITKTEFECATKDIKQTFVAQVSGGVPPYNSLVKRNG
jgi:hypothetical protein